MDIPYCPICGKTEFVSLLKSGKRAFCENCGEAFDIPFQAPDERRSGLKLFLSYPHTAAGVYNICEDIAAFLKERGHDVWFDQDQLTGHHGIDWRKKISEGIQNSQLVLSCLNRHAVRVVNGRRGVCLDELSIAISTKGGNINTVLLEPEDVVKPSAALSHRQWLDMSAWHEKYEAGEAVFRPWFDQKMKDLARMVESDENYTFDGQITEVAEKLTMTDFRLDKHELLEKPFVGREWLAQELDSWLCDPNGGKLCAIYGDPGVGKSAFAVQYAFSSSEVAALICFEYGNPHYNSVPGMIRALAFQLACRLNDYRTALLETLNRISLVALSDEELFDQLLVKPLTARHIDGAQETLCIILDGLDECGEGEKNVAAEVLGRCVEKLPSWIRVLVTSRRESAVITHIASNRVIEMRGSDKMQQEDIRSFFLQSLAEKIPEQDRREKTSEELTQRSDGSFLYAFLTAEAINTGLLNPEDSPSFPDRLGQSLTLWMERLFPDLQEYRARFMLPIGALLASPDPLPQEELERILGMSETEVRDFKRRMKVFLADRTDDFGNQTLIFEHRYVQEWLAGEDAGVFAVSAKDAMKALAEGCYRLFRKDPEKLNIYEAFWIYDFLEQARMDDQLKEALLSEKLFDTMAKHEQWCRTWGKYRLAGQFNMKMGRNAGARLDEQGAALDVCYDMTSCTVRMADYAMTAGRIDDAIACMRSSVEFYESLLEQEDLLYIAWCLCNFYEKLGSYLETQGKLEEAMELYQKSLTKRELMTSRPEVPDPLEDLAGCCDRIGGIYEAQGRLDSALEMYQKSRELREGLLKESDTPDRRWNASLSWGRIAGIDMTKGFLEEALDLYQQIIAVQESKAEESGTPNELKNLAYVYTCTGRIYENQGRLDEAMQMYQNSWDIRRDLLTEIHTPKECLDLATSCVLIGDIYRQQGKLDEALKSYEQALSMTEDFVEEPGTPEYRRETAGHCTMVAAVYDDRGDPAEAVPLLERAHSLLEPLAEELGTLSAYEDLFMSKNNLGQVLEKLNRLEEALDFLESACQICDELCEKQKQNQHLLQLQPQMHEDRDRVKRKIMDCRSE